MEYKKQIEGREEDNNKILSYILAQEVQNARKKRSTKKILESIGVITL